MIRSIDRLRRAAPEALADLVLPDDRAQATLVGRVWRPDEVRPVPVFVEGETWRDLSELAPTVSHLLERGDLREALGKGVGRLGGGLAGLLADSLSPTRDLSRQVLLAPSDLQPVKACGVTYAASAVERVIEERSGGSAARGQAVRAEVERSVGSALAGVKPGSPQAAALKEALTTRGLWSHYLEVAIGPDAESFTKCPPLAAVGFGADVGVRSDSGWNNPEPELVLAVRSDGEIVGTTLGNDVNLRDFEGRSPMLLDKAKDNNASCAIGPFIRLFDDHYGLDDARAARIGVSVRGADGFACDGEGEVAQISRDLTDLAGQSLGRHHRYPDGLMLFTGTMWVPSHDRDGTGEGFTHRDDDDVLVVEPRLGALLNRVRRCEDCAPWSFGLRHLIDALATPMHGRRA